MGARDREWAKEARLKLIEELGGECQKCGEKRTKKLQFDHINGTKDWQPSRLGQGCRMRRYIKEAEQGLIQLLCKKCNIRKGNEAMKYENGVAIPF